MPRTHKRSERCPTLERANLQLLLTDPTACPGTPEPLLVQRRLGGRTATWLTRMLNLTSGLNAYYQQAGPVHTPHNQSVSQAPRQKPFSNIARSPNAFERYWPLMLQVEVDSKTGVAYIDF
jgi:hypothetical protein